jgi:hypothetical protein
MTFAPDAPDAPGPKRPSGSLADVPYMELVAALRTLSVHAIARRYGVDRTTVRYWRQKLLRDQGARVLFPPILCPQTCHLFSPGATVSAQGARQGDRSLPLRGQRGDSVTSPLPPGESQVAGNGDA